MSPPKAPHRIGRRLSAFRSVLLATLCALIAGCGGPSDAEIESAVIEAFDQQIHQALGGVSLPGIVPTISLEDFLVIQAPDENDQGHYVAGVQFTVVTQGGLVATQPMTQKARVTLTELDSGEWDIVEMQDLQ